MAAYDEGHDALRDRVDMLHAAAEDKLAAKIITVMSGKGGIGKTFIAKELAWVLNAVLLDFDWDGGRVSNLFGYDVDKRVGVPLLDALDKDRTPRLVHMERRPDLVPGHPDFAVNQPDAATMKDALIRWATDWKRPVVVDTHPGGGAESTRGAMAAADLVVMPVILGTAELNALEEDLANFDGFPLLLVPNWVPPAPSAAHMKRLGDLAATYGVQIADNYVRRHEWMRTRQVRTVVTAAPKWSERSFRVAEDITNAAEEVISRAA